MNIEREAEYIAIRLLVCHHRKEYEDLYHDQVERLYSRELECKKAELKTTIDPIFVPEGSMLDAEENQTA
jgi:hypothetical protein